MKVRAWRQLKSGLWGQRQRLMWELRVGMYVRSGSFFGQIVHQSLLMCKNNQGCCLEFSSTLHKHTVYAKAHFSSGMTFSCFLSNPSRVRWFAKVIRKKESQTDSPSASETTARPHSSVTCFSYHNHVSVLYWQYDFMTK